MSAQRIPVPALVVLVGPSGAGKSTWAARYFSPDQIVSSDRLRAMVGEGEYDQRASQDAFELLDLLVERRLARKLTTVVDTTGLDDERRRSQLALARRHGLPSFVVAFDTPGKVCRERNRQKERPVPAKALSAQIRRFTELLPKLAGEDHDGLLSPDPVELVAPAYAGSKEHALRQRREPKPLAFDLQLSSFVWPGGREEFGKRLAAIVHTAEEAGFTGFWVMDHFIQIPQVGREWEDLPEAYTTLGYLAAATARARLGTLVTGITYRNVGLVAKMIATLDVLSGGRAVCGLGAAWFEREHRAYGWEFPPAGERLDLLEDALQVLPLLWGPGAPAFEGKRIIVPEAMGYPRPLQERVPIVVGGSGERRTLRLVAQYADGCNLQGGPDAVAAKLEVLERHCRDVGRDPDEIEVTHLSTALVGADRTELQETVERLRPRGVGRERFAGMVGAGTVDDHIGRFRQLAESGIDTAIVRLADVGDTGPVEQFGAVIEAFR